MNPDGASISRRVLSLNGDGWRLGRAPSEAVPERSNWEELARVDGWLPATVPGNVRADLIRAGSLPELDSKVDVEALQWVDDHCWWLVREFGMDQHASERVHLVLRGIDYVNDLHLNGHHLGRHEGMFSPQIHEVSDLLRSQNLLAVRIVGSRWLPRDRSSRWERLLRQVDAQLGALPGRFPARRDTLKCQMSFGWDFAPPLRTMGIWDDVYLITSQDLFIQDVATRQKLAGDTVLVTVLVTVHASRHQSVRLRCKLSGRSSEAEPLVVEREVRLAPGECACSTELEVAQPRLWWPWDHGDPELYWLTVELLDGERLLDAVSQSLGLRQIEMNDWTMAVNGHRVYARGANWVPPDLLPGRVTEADYHSLLALARQANINLLRVWGGGLREKRAFYDLCDQLGILVWQEFPFACAFVARYPRSPQFLQVAEAEARAIVRDLRNHACLALWCGGNEFSPRRNAPLIDALGRAVASEDPHRPFLPASPALGDSHNWEVWHRFHPPSVYRQDEAAFASEFGLQAPPNVPTLQRFLPREELWPAGPAWTQRGAGLAKLRRYARPFQSDLAPTLERFVEASQQAQARGLQIAIEHYRRRKARGCGGMAVWQFNEPWPAISWSLVDFYGQPKPAYEMVKRLYNPLLVSVDFTPKRFRGGDTLDCDVWIINDRGQSYTGCHLTVELQNSLGACQRQFSHTLDVPADSAEMVSRLEWKLPMEADWSLCCTLTQGASILATNEYDLAVNDQIQPTPRQRLRNWLTQLVTPA